MLITSLLSLLACDFSIGGEDTDDQSAYQGPETDLDCDADLTEAAPTEDCITTTISCGETVSGSTEGSASEMAALVYESAYCFVPFHDYDGAERVYELIIPAETQAKVSLASPCSELSLAALRWEETDECPLDDSHGIAQCEGLEAGDGGEVTINSQGEARYLVSVDSAQGMEANFELSVACTAH